MMEDRMKIKEIAELLELLGKLPVDKQIEFYYMIKGAAVVTERVDEFGVCRLR